MSDEAAAFIRRLVRAWECCGTSGGGVLAEHDRPVRAAAVARLTEDERGKLAGMAWDISAENPDDEFWTAIEAMMAARVAAALAPIEALADEDAQRRLTCASDPDCPCWYKDCYECGKWHNCIHTPWTAHPHRPHRRRVSQHRAGGRGWGCGAVSGGAAVLFCRACGEVMPGFWAPLHFQDCAEIRRLRTAAADQGEASGDGEDDA